jgi:hypothetical protein
MGDRSYHGRLLPPLHMKPEHPQCHDGSESGATEYECNDNGLRPWMDVGLPRILDSWGILGRGEMGHCRQLPQGNDSEWFPRREDMALFS